MRPLKPERPLAFSLTVSERCAAYAICHARRRQSRGYPVRLTRAPSRVLTMRRRFIRALPIPRWHMLRVLRRHAGLSQRLATLQLPGVCIGIWPVHLPYRWVLPGLRRPCLKDVRLRNVAVQCAC